MTERATLLANTDPEMRREVESLLAQPTAGTPLDRSAFSELDAEWTSAATRRDGPPRRLSMSEVRCQGDLCYCSRVASRCPQIRARTLPAGSKRSAVSELENAVPAALSRIVEDTFRRVPSGAPSGAPTGAGV